MRRDQLPPTSRHTFVLERHKIVYVSTPKVACTSLKWVIADIAGEDAEVFRRATRSTRHRPATIHQRRLWQRVPTLHDLSDDKLADIDAANGWHVFAVVRHPTSRLWSAWQQKLLPRVPRAVAQVPAHIVPPLPRTTADVAEGFRRFVAGLAAGECNQLLRENGHFAVQSDLLAADRMPYTRVYDLGEMDQVMADLNERVKTQGGEPVEVEPLGALSTLKPQRSMFTPDALAAIRAAYESDFQRWFADAEVLPPGVLDDNHYPDSVLDEIREQAARSGAGG
jgi:Sulfotransferase family